MNILFFFYHCETHEDDVTIGKVFYVVFSTDKLFNLDINIH